MPICTAFGLLTGLIMLSELLKIETDITSSGLSFAEVARTASMDRDFLRRVRRGEFRITRNSIVRLKLAIARIRRKDNAPEGALPSACYRLAIAFVADKAGVVPDFILSTNPSRRATADPQWLQAARLRRIALYITNIYLNVAQADLARAAGMSKAAVSIALNDLEDERGRPEIETILSAVEEAFQG